MALIDLNEKFRGHPSRLLSSLRNNIPGQSYVIQGDSIEEISEFTDEWVKTLACLDLKEHGACGLCRHCKLIESGNYPEIYKLEPASKSRTILVDSLRGFQNRFYMKSASGVKKIGIIVEADRMQVQAQNAFLKTLEEPPPDTFLLLLTTRLEGLLDTIRSRCRMVSLAANRICYDDNLKSGLIQILQDVSGKDGAATALEAQARVKEIFAGLKKKAQLEIEESHTISTQEADDPQLRKKFKEKQVVLIEGRYKMYREQVLSMMEVWVSQNYLLVNGIGASDLAHEEICSKSWTYSSEEAKKALDLIEQLKLDLGGNVNEDLAIENFFLQICQK